VTTARVDGHHTERLGDTLPSHPSGWEYAGKSDRADPEENKCVRENY
jgi:hypothetical protein